MSERKHFGTDGIRGAVGEHPITAEFMLRLGWAAGQVLCEQEGSRVVIGKDTRISGYMFESALEAGLSSAGVDVALLGPMPTPAIAYLTRTLHARAGIVISASHNPFHDNGIKFFSSTGSKLADDVEHAIERKLDEPMTTVISRALGKATRVTDAEGRYIEFCKATFPMSADLKGLKLVVDCANGATYKVAPSVFTELGATVTTLGTTPDGLNINKDCGATSIAALQKAVVEQQADLGIALDGDGDRLIMVDSQGNKVDGDELLYIIACERKATGTSVPGVVGTQMSNLGLQHALESHGIALHRSKVGDRYVMELLQQHGLVLGAENSGHIICLDKTTTGDGIVSALQVLAAMMRTGKSLHELLADMTLYPQTLINVPVSGKPEISGSDAVQGAVRTVEARLASSGRVLLRPSGTEPLIRVMVEGEDSHVVETAAREIAEVVSAALG